MSYYSPSHQTFFTGLGGKPEFERAARAQDRYEAQQARSRMISMGSAGRSAIASAKKHAQGAKKASRQQMTAANKMQNMYAAQRKRSRKDIQRGTRKAVEGMNPWRDAGVTALGKLQDKIMSGPGKFKESPGYQFRLGEGQKAIERSAAARGGALSGAAVKASLRYGQDFATADYDNFLRRYYESMAPLERMSGKGQEAAGRQGDYYQQGARDLSQSGIASTNKMGEAAQYYGESEAGGTMNAANIMAIAEQAEAERNYGYEAWKQGGQF